MNTSDYEKLLISIVLRWPTTDNLIAEKCTLTTQSDKFTVSEHKLIWTTICQCVDKNMIPDIGNVIIQLGNKLDNAGGEVYLRSLHDFSANMKINTNDSWETYCNLVNKHGTLKQLELILTKYKGKADDFDNWVKSVKEPDEILANISEEIQQITKGIGTHYVPISTAFDEDFVAIEKARRGDPDILICGMPSFESFGIPYAPSLGIIQGLESKGKSQLGFQIILGKAIYLDNNNIPGCAAIDTFEMARRDVARRMACFMAGIDSTILRFGTGTEEEYERYYEKAEYIKGLPIQINHSLITSDKLKLEAIAQNIKCRRFMGMSDYATLFIDKKENEEQRLTQITSNLKSLSKTIDSSEILLVQINREGRNKTQAGLGKAKGTSTFEQAADWYIEILNYPQMVAAGMTPRVPDYRNENMAYGLVLKNKNGKLGEIELGWNAKFTRFTDQKCKLGQLYSFESVEEEEPSDF